MSFVLCCGQVFLCLDLRFSLQASTFYSSRINTIPISSDMATHIGKEGIALHWSTIITECLVLV